MTIWSIHLAHPMWLLLAPVLFAAVVLIARRSISGLGRRAAVAAMVVRLVVVLSAVVALCEPSIQDEAEHVALVVVSDESSSMPRSARDDLRDVLEPAIVGAHAEDAIAVVSAARQARVQSLPFGVSGLRTSGEDPLAPLQNEKGPRDATDLGTALALAPALVRGESGTRVLLVSDGNETEGDMLASAQSLSALGIPVDVMLPRQQGRSEIILEELAVPQTARKGATVDLRVVLRSTHVASGRLSVLRNGRMVDLTPGEQGGSLAVVLPVGEHVLSVPITLTGSGPQSFEAVFEADDERADGVAANNRGIGVTFVEGEGAVLFITDDPVGAEPLLSALGEAKIEVEIIQPEAVGWDAVELGRYDAIVLFDTSADQMSLRQQEAVATFVHAGGGGLVVVGGPDSLGAGGWIGTPIEEVLPVRLDPPSERQLPRGALALVLDASGSMGSPVGSSGLSQQQVANKAAWYAASTLTPLDEIVVVSFDTQSTVRVPLQPMRNKMDVKARIESIGPGGGTYILGGLRTAIEALKGARGSVKHIILLTDGQDGTGMGEAIELIDAMAAEQMTLSTVAVGDGANTQLLGQLASASGGRTYTVTTTQQLLQLDKIFIKEARIVQRPLIWEGEPVSASVTAMTTTMQGMPGRLPAVTGYVITADREGLSTITSRFPNEHEDPLSAQWQHGLGRVVVFTSDSVARWSASWMGWQPYRTFWEQHMRWAMRPSGSPNIRVSTRREGARTRVLIEAMRDDGSPLDLARFQGRVLSPRGEVGTLSVRQIGPGRYESVFDVQESGAYMVTMAYEGRGSADGSGGDSGIIRTAHVHSFSDELRWTAPNRRALQRVAAATGGRMIDPDNPPTDLFSQAGVSMPVSREPIWLIVAAAAMGLFLLDIGVRRVRLELAMLLRPLRAGKRIEREDEERLAGLQVARQRAAHRAEPAASTPTFTKPAPVVIPAGGKTSTQAIPSAQNTSQSTSQLEEESAQEEETGMSRLLSAKRRAQESLQGEDQHTE